MKNGDMPAMAVPLNPGEKSIYGCPPDGLTKREYFAGLAMQSIFESVDLERYNTNTIAKMACTQADALLTALEESNQ